jgi:hypothetical protein
MSTKFAKTAFVIMPFADEYKTSFDDIIKPAINNIGLNCIRADQEPLGHIHQMMFERIFESTVVIADITGKNPNVFYELGVSHTAAAKTITICREDFAELIPFDIAPYRVIIYPKPPAEDASDQAKKQYEQLRNEAVASLSTAVSTVIENKGGGVSNPVQSYLATISPIKCKESRYFDYLTDSEEEKMIREADSELIIVGITNLHFLKILARVVENGERTKPLYVKVLSLNPNDHDGWRYVYHLREGKIINDQDFRDFLADDQVTYKRGQRIINRLNEHNDDFKGEILYYPGIPVFWAYVIDQSRIIVGNYAMNRLFAKLPITVLVENDPRTHSMYRYYRTVVEGLYKNAVPQKPD